MTIMVQSSMHFGEFCRTRIPNPVDATSRIRRSSTRVCTLTIAALLVLLTIPAFGALAGACPSVLDSEVVETRSHPIHGYRPDRGMFLLAAPRLRDPRFARTVVLLLEYDETGALGIVINRPTQFSLRDASPQPLPGTRDHYIHYGGPVEPGRLTALLREPVSTEETQRVFGDVYGSISFDTLRRNLEHDERAADVRAYAGYAGWAPGQLDAELARDDWIVTPADAGSIFDASPDDVWHDLMRRNAGRWVRRGRLDSA